MTNSYYQNMQAIGTLLTEAKARNTKFNTREDNDRDIRAGKSGEYLWWRNLGIVLSACKSWAGSFDSGDVIGLSWVAMSNALRLYNPDAGAGFAGYYRRWLDNACNDLLHKTQIVQVPIHKKTAGVVLDYSHPDAFQKSSGDGDVSSPWDLLPESHSHAAVDTQKEIMDILESAQVEPAIQEFMLAEGGIDLREAARKCGMCHQTFAYRLKAERQRIRKLMR